MARVGARGGAGSSPAGGTTTTRGPDFILQNCHVGLPILMPRTQCSAELAKRSGPLARVQPALDLQLLRRVIVRPSDDVPVSTANLLPLIKRCSQDAETLQRALLLLRELATGGGAPGAPRALIVLAELLDRMPRALAALAPPPLVPLPWLTRVTADGRNLVTHQAASAEEYMSAAAESIAACVGTAKVSFSPSGKLPQDLPDGAARSLVRVRVRVTQSPPAAPRHPSAPRHDSLSPIPAPP